MKQYGKHTSHPIDLSVMTKRNRYQSEIGFLDDMGGFSALAQEICENSDNVNKDALLSDLHFRLGSIAAKTHDHTKSREHKEESFNIQRNIHKEYDTFDERFALSHSELAISRIQDGRYDEGISLLEYEQGRRAFLPDFKYVPLSRDANLGFAYTM